MKIIVKVRPSSKVEEVERIGQPQLDFGGSQTELVVYKVSVKEPPIDGRANRAVAKALAEYFGVSVSQVELRSGQNSKQKIFVIDSQ